LVFGILLIIEGVGLIIWAFRVRASRHGEALERVDVALAETSRLRLLDCRRLTVEQKPGPNIGRGPGLGRVVDPVEILSDQRRCSVRSGRSVVSSA
jgi:hypothetical protein